jgi:four helix bundle protein
MRDMRERTKAFALRIIRLYGSLPKTTEAQTIGKQVLRSGTSIGAHYREASRGKSTPDFVSKIEGATQEADETCYWLELLIDGEIVSAERMQPLLDEANELLAILITMAKHAKERK